jgi:GT2 family glycosyltransferase
MIEFISATRMTREAFQEKAALALSLERLEAQRRWTLHVAYENRRGLSEVFNERIRASSEHDILAFVHDDIWIDDLFVADQLAQALDEFHVIGVAGNLRRIPRQPGWSFVQASPRFIWDDARNLSGAVAHGGEAYGAVRYFGSAPAECELLDGVFLAARRSALLEHGVLFDPRFKFHFYDLDFCRTARARGLRVGTWPIAITHQSVGAFGTPDWQATYAAYLEKWQD